MSRSIPALARPALLVWLQDTQLPKLISGDLRVQDAQRFVGGADTVDEVDGGRA